MTMQSNYKPSPLGGGYGSPRSSPFRRAESPASPSPLRQSTQPLSPSKLGPTTSSFTPPTAFTAVIPPETPKTWTPRGHARQDDAMSPSPLRGASTRPQPSTGTNANALSQLQPSQVRTLREGFQLLDRDSDGTVNREDVADMLNQLGLPSGPSDVTQFFPASGPQTMTTAVFINSLATALASLSPPAELLSAFSAFDDDDSGQIDVAELRDALLHTAPEPGERALSESDIDKVLNGFTGRRAFTHRMSVTNGVNGMHHGGLGKRGEVFKYQEFVNSISGSNTSQETAHAE